jgi:HK97 family phage prohead protease
MKFLRFKTAGDADGYLSIELKAVGEAGKFSGIASIYGVEDLGGDIVDKGAFTKTVAENPQIPILWMHDQKEVIGVGQVKEWQGKLMIDASLDMEDPAAQKAFRKMKAGLIKGLSIGYKTIKSTYQTVEDKLIRHIQELKLYEVSVVTFPMLPAAQVTRTKQQEERDGEALRLLQETNSALLTRVEALEAKAEPPLTKTEPVDDHSAAALDAAKKILDALGQ